MDVIDYKICNICNEKKELDNFRKRNYCKKCEYHLNKIRNENMGYAKSHYQKYKEEIKHKALSYYHNGYCDIVKERYQERKLVTV